MFPEPKSMTVREGTYRLNPSLIDNLHNCTTSIEQLPGVLFNHDDRQAPEAFSLLIQQKNITLNYADFGGRYYGLLQLKQYIKEESRDGSVPCADIFDQPAFKERGVMLDISRNRVPTMETFKKYIKMFANLRFNQLQLYTEHTFAYTRHEQVWKDYLPMTPGEIQELDALCRLYAIELIPNQNSFGHLEPFLKYPEYHHLAEAPDGYDDPWGSHPEVGSSLYPRSPQTLEFLENLYDELLPNFTSRTLNVGCDETFDLCQGKSKDRCDRLGMGKVYLDFVKSLNTIVEKRGFRTQFWGDMIESHPELIPEIPKSMQAVCWWYEGDGSMEKRVAPYAESGIDFQIWPGTSAWMTLTGRWKNVVDNISESIDAGKKRGASGLVMTDWGDHGHWNPLVLSLLPLAAGGLGFWKGEIPTEEALAVAVENDDLLGMPKGFSQLLLQMGNLYTKLPFKLHNTTPWSVILIQHYVPAYRNDFLANRDSLNQFDWTALIKELENIREGLAASVIEDKLIQDEAIWSCDISLLGMKLCRSYVASGAEKWLPDELDSISAAGFAADLRVIADRFQGIWLRRSRPDGLQFSYGRMIELAEILENVGE